MRERSPKSRVLLAAVVALVLAGSLWFRARSVSADAAPQAPAARVAEPAPLDLARLEMPCWSCRDAQQWPVRSRVDLDLVAPLGDGPGNAAEFFRDFAKDGGARWPELQRAREKEMVDGPADLGRIFPADHPLLDEAEPWVDQATMRFYPELLSFAGWDTTIPDLIFDLELAKSWVARGRASSDAQAALADFRRAVRLGRLLRQEDTTIIADLVGLACLRIGLSEIYDQARRRDDAETALVAAVALSEIAPQRLLTSERVTRVDVTPFLSEDRKRLELPPTVLDQIVAMATGDPDRRFRGEATLDLGIVAHLATGAPKQRATEVLETLERGGDERIAELARWARSHPPGPVALGEGSGG